jgi:hypothetical protein
LLKDRLSIRKASVDVRDEVDLHAAVVRQGEARDGNAIDRPLPELDACALEEVRIAVHYLVDGFALLEDIDAHAEILDGEDAELAVAGAAAGGKADGHVFRERTDLDARIGSEVADGVTIVPDIRPPPRSRRSR